MYCMTVLKINEFEGYDVDEFIEFVSVETNGKFSIHIPKETTLFSSPNDEISHEYAIVAYIGQKLHEISSTFDYYPADISKPGEFVFTITTNDFTALGELIAEISSVFGNSETIEPINFVNEVSSFIEEFKDRQVSCKDLFDIAVEYSL